MQHKYIVCDPALCTGCRLCEFACALVKEGRFDLELSRIRTSRPEPTTNLAVACRLCLDAPCVKACPRSALAVSSEDGVIEVTKALCTGCGWCIEACDFGAIALDRRSKCVAVCDLCREIGEPACAAACPKGALAKTTPAAVATAALDRVASRESRPACSDARIKPECAGSDRSDQSEQNQEQDQHQQDPDHAHDPTSQNALAWLSAWALLLARAGSKSMLQDSYLTVAPSVSLM